MFNGYTKILIKQIKSKRKLSDNIDDELKF